MNATPPAPSHVLVVDDHDVVRVGLAQLLRGVRQGCGVSEDQDLPRAQAALAARRDIALVANNGSTLSFVGDVSGSGSFSGAVRFLPGYAPGHSTAPVLFGGGNVAFGEHALLTLEIDGSAAGTGFAQWLNIDTRSFDGTLALALGSSFLAAPGTRLALLNFNALQGPLDAARIVVSGYDAQQLDLLRLAIDGRVTVTAVPEPATWALWLAGLGVAASGFKRPRQTRRSA